MIRVTQLQPLGPVEIKHPYTEQNQILMEASKKSAFLDLIQDDKDATIKFKHNSTVLEDAGVTLIRYTASLATIIIKNSVFFWLR